MKNGFTKNVLIVSIGPLVSSVVSFLAEPWIARYWEPEIFGMVSYFNAFLLILTPSMFLRYNYAIIQSRSKTEESNLFALSLIIMVFAVVGIYLLYPLFSKLFSNDFSFESYKAMFFLALVFGSFNILFRFWATADKRFIHISISTILLQLSFTGLLLYFGYNARTDTDTIIMIRVMSYVVSPLIMLAAFFKIDLKTYARLISIDKIIEMARHYVRFPAIEFWGFLAGLTAFSVPVIIIANYWGQEVNGLFSKAFFILYIFVLFIGESIGRVLHKEVSEMVIKGKPIDKFLMDIVKTLITISLLPFSILALAAPEVFTLFLGEMWYQSGVFAQIIAPWMFASIISIAVLPVFAVLNKQQYYTGFQFVTLAGRIMLLVIFGKMQMDVNLAILIFSIANFIILLLQMWSVLRLAAVDMKVVSRLSIKPVLEIVPLFVVFYVIKYLYEPQIIQAVLIISVLSVPYVYLFYYKSINLNFFKKAALK